MMTAIRTPVVLVALWLFAAPTPSAEPRAAVLIDIAGAGSGSQPSSFVAAGPLVYFTANDPLYGRELWRTDGTRAGTSMVMDIEPGPPSSSPLHLTAAGSRLFFFARTQAGWALYITDGSQAGTIALRPFEAPPQLMAGFGERVVFSIGQSETGVELWISDATESGTRLVRDINPGQASSEPLHMTPLGPFVYFTAQTGNGRELWRTDGTSGGTFEIKDIHPGPGSSLPSFLTVYDSYVFFSAYTPADGAELWRTNGTAGGTYQVKNINPLGDSSPSGLAAAGGKLYFSANDGVHGSELWSTRGDAETTSLVQDLVAGPASSSPAQFVEFGGLVYFIAGDSASLRLWSTTGSSATAVHDAATNIHGIVNNRLLFQSFIAEYGTELWRLESGTVSLVRDILPGPVSSNPSFGRTPVNNLLIGVATANIIGSELFRTDGTNAGTSVVREINTLNGNSLPREFTDFNGTLYFTASEPASGRELWKSAGSAATTSLVRDIASGIASSDPAFLTVLDNALLFAAGDVAGRELWKTDGAAVSRVADIWQGATGSTPEHLFRSGGRVYFIASDPANGRELWRTDGTLQGTLLVKDIVAGAASAFGTESPSFAEYQGRVYFFAGSGSLRALWSTDGTAAGTAIVNETPAAANLTVAGDRLYFTAAATAAGNELWSSAGTPAGTAQFADLQPGEAGSSPDGLTAFQGTLYFSAWTSTHGRELYRIAGTAPALVANLAPAAADSNPSQLVAFAGKLYFTASDAATGAELWKTDGTPEGTSLVIDLRPGPASSRIAELRQIDGFLYFQADDGLSGAEFWRSDGTASGTVLAQDLATAASDPAAFRVAGPNLYFTATEPLTGAELYVLPRHKLTATAFGPGRIVATPATPDSRYVHGSPVRLSTEDGECGQFANWNLLPANPLVLDQPREVTASFACYLREDRTGQFQISRTPLELNTETGRYVQRVILRNNGSIPVYDVALALDLPAGVSLHSADGVTVCIPSGWPYLNLGNIGAGAGGTLILEFQAPEPSAGLFPARISVSTRVPLPRVPVNRACR